MRLLGGRGAAVPTGTELPAARSGSGGRSRGRVAASAAAAASAETPELAGQRWACVPGGGGADDEPEAAATRAWAAGPGGGAGRRRRRRGAWGGPAGSGRSCGRRVWGAEPQPVVLRGLLPFPGARGLPSPGEPGLRFPARSA